MTGKTLATVLICLALLSFLLLILFLSDFSSRPLESPRASRNFGSSGEWPMHRGGPSLRGHAPCRLPQELSLLWRYQTSAEIVAPASVSENAVYVGDTNGVLYALGAEKGELLWKFQAEGEIQGAPLILDGLVYFGTTDGLLYCVRKGELLWKFECDDKIPSGPNWVQFEKKKLILFGSYDNNLYCLDSKSGKKIWSYESGYYINGTPAVWQKNCVFGGCDAFIHLVDLKTGKKVGIFNCGVYIGASVCVGEGLAYVGNYEGSFFCVDLKGLAPEEKESSRALVWKIRPTEDPILSSASLGQKEVVFGSDDGRVRCVDRRNGEELWSYLTGGPVRGSPVIAGKEVVVGSEDGNLYVLDLEKGRLRWRYRIGPSIKTSPAVAQGRIYVGAEDGYLYVFGAKRS